MTQNRHRIYANDSLDKLLDEATGILSRELINQQDIQDGLLMREKLTKALYRHWYTRSMTVKHFKFLSQANLAEVFRAVHPGTLHWESGWTVESVSSTGRIIASREGERRMLNAADYICTESPGRSANPGSRIDVVGRIDSIEQQPGYWIAYSRNWQDAKNTLLRIYWNVGPEGAVQLARLIPDQFSDKVPYSFKLPLEIDNYQRADAAVLYFEAEHFEQITPVLRSLAKQLEFNLFPNIPALCKKLEAGVAFAEEPAENVASGYVSFGIHRCSLIVDAFLACRKTIGANREKFNILYRESIISHLSDQGISYINPHLNPGSRFRYEW